MIPSIVLDNCFVRLCYPTSSDPSESYLRSHRDKYTDEILNCANKIILDPFKSDSSLIYLKTYFECSDSCDALRADEILAMNGGKYLRWSFAVSFFLEARATGAALVDDPSCFFDLAMM